MNEFTEKFADLTIKMREAEIAKMAAFKLRDTLFAVRRDLLRDAGEFVPGVYDVENGHVIIRNDGNISFHART